MGLDNTKRRAETLSRRRYEKKIRTNCYAIMSTPRRRRRPPVGVELVKRPEVLSGERHGRFCLIVGARGTKWVCGILHTLVDIGHILVPALYHIKKLRCERATAQTLIHASRVVHHSWLARVERTWIVVRERGVFLTRPLLRFVLCPLHFPAVGYLTFLLLFFKLFFLAPDLFCNMSIGLGVDGLVGQ